MTESTSKPSIVATGVHKRFKSSDGEVHAVQDVSFEFSPGDFVALHGPSGCGKSTLLLMAGVLLSPDQGTLEIDGTHPYDGTPEDRATFRSKHIGFVFQQFHLIPYLDVLENVLVSDLANPSTRTSSVDRAKELLETFQLGHRLRHVPSKLSVGEQQRVSLARALLQKPTLLLADEPTGNLDPENSKIILEHLAGFAEDGGTILMATHDQQARQAANRSIGLIAGQTESHPA